MRVLEITFIPPDKSSGGGLGVYQSIKSLAGNCDVDYIGPEFEALLFEGTKNKVSVHTMLKPRKQNGIFALARLAAKKVTTSFYDAWVACKQHIIWEKYDFVHIEFSRYAFVLSECHKHNQRCIVRMHNIETDYSYNIYRSNKNMFNLLRYYSFAVNEKKVLGAADLLIFLTDKDIKRAKELQKIDEVRIRKNPVCLETSEKLHSKNHEGYSILLTGSLGYGPNAEGIIWFLKNVWKKLSFLKEFQDVSVTIAGAHPGDNIKKCISGSERVSLVDTPKKMEPYFAKADIYVAAVFDGAGMKVKVAEALSYGLPVIGTSHAFIGYEDIKLGKYVADTENEFQKTLKDICLERKKTPEMQEIFKQFENYLSMNSSVYRYREFISGLENL